MPVIVSQQPDSVSTVLRELREDYRLYLRLHGNNYLLNN